MARGINLIPEEIQAGWRLRRIRTALAGAAAVYLALMFMVFMTQISRINSKKAALAFAAGERDALLAKNAPYLELAKKYKELQQAEAELKKKLNVTSDLNEKRVSWATVLKKLSYDVPQGVWLRSISTSDIQGTNGKKIRFLGTSRTNKGITDFVFTLENAPHLQDVALSYSQKRDYKSSTVYDFEIYAALRKTDGIMYEW